VPDQPRRVEADGLYTPDIKAHSLEKIHLHNRYAEMFATAMHDKWPHLAYIGLYAGAGHARLAGTDETYETSALAVLRQRPRFTDYVYVDNDPRCVHALRARTERLRGDARVSVIPGDVNESAAAVQRALPWFSRRAGLLSFCFVDPFDIQLRFDTIRQLGRLKMDFLILLMLGMDARRNFRQYRDDPSSTRIGDLIDRPGWRDEYRHGEKVIPFLLRKFDQAMQSIGYIGSAGNVHSVRVAGMGVLQYVLAFYSKSAVGIDFWGKARAGLSSQLGLGL
jgi:three-Cys-motif partner protein